ncbi:MAG: hypothetical protein EOP83_06340, partial [Verrucomicrobiaceae bacterium]
MNNTIINVKLGYNTSTVTREDGSITYDRVEVMVFLIEEAEFGDTVKMTRGRDVLWDDKSGNEKFFTDRAGLDQLEYERMTDTFEYYYGENGWEIAQSPHAETDPLFHLYTTDKVRHDKLPGSTFAGNALFGYARPEIGTYDKVLLRYITRDDKGQIVFTYSQATDRTLVNGTELEGFQLFRVVGDTRAEDRFSNGWYPTQERSYQALVNGVFETPLNLLGNPDNTEVGLITRSQWFDNMVAVMKRQPGFDGSPYNVNTYRDTARNLGQGYTGPAWVAGLTYAVNDTVRKGGFYYRCTVAHIAGADFDPTKWDKRPLHQIIQNRSPLLKTMLLASDRRFDYLDACRFMDQEYNRFRNKFVQQTLEVLRTGQRREEESDDAWLDTILGNLIIAKTVEFPFALSTMAGAQYYIPPTAASMGILPVVEPGIEVDATYNPAVTFLRGHDGSRTPISGGFQDRILLALEFRIWRAILAQFKTEAKPPFDFFDLDEARNRGNGTGDEITSGDPNPCDNDPSSVETGKTTYSRAELIKMYTPIFIRWAQTNGLDYRINNGYVQTDPFTFNYHGIKDRDGVEMPGNWRAIYRYYFDTDRPHVAPWQMLGFATQPVWWESQYGAAPYTSGNLPLWEDLRDGMIRGGPRAGYDSRFTRPDIFDILPVDDQGRLRDPIATGIIPQPPTPTEATRPWQIGDHGPVENLWINSASYPFARCQLGFLMRPAEWVEVQWDTQYLKRLDDGQWYNDRTHSRPVAALTTVHGETLASTGLPQAVYGIQQWIVDQMTARSQDPSILGTAIRSMQARLSHKMAGFTQADSLRVFADNSGILPSEDVTVTLLESPPLREAIYSGVIVEWTGNGYSVVGYDTTKEGFCILVGDPGSKSLTISLGDDPAIYEWHPKTYYSQNVLVDHLGSVYRCVRAHMSGPKFEDEFWNPEVQKRIRYPKVTVYANGTGDFQYVPYGTVFKTIQEVASFLWDFGRAQVAAGFVFDYVDEATGQIQDWELMVREFLTWAQMDWQPGQFIALSPGASQLKFVTDHGMVYNIEETANGIYGLLDRTGRPLPRRSTFVSRLDEETKIITTTDDLFMARVRVGEVEHALVFSNLTIFNDVIYQPLYTLRQPRLRLIGLRTPDWKGRRDAPGYMVREDEVQPNFWRSAENLRTMFEVEGSEDKTLRDYARHVLGYQTRPYLDNLLVSETEQFEFYQGMIQQKGAPGVFQKLTRSRIVDDHTDLLFQEEWGVRAGTFGALSTARYVSFNILRTDLRSNPQVIQFGIDDPDDAILGLPNTSTRWVERPADYMKVFSPTQAHAAFNGITSPTIEQDIEVLPSAGPVRLTEVDLSCFYPSLLPRLYQIGSVGNADVMKAGTRIWIYDTQTRDQTYDVLRGYDIGPPECRIVKVEMLAEDSSLRAETRISFTVPHGLTTERDAGLYIIIPDTVGTTPDLRGIQRIVRVDSPTSILVSFVGQTGSDLFYEMRPTCYIFRSQRFATLALRDAFYATFRPVQNQLCYVDSVAGFLGWVVYIYTGSDWKVYRQQPPKIDSRRLTKTLIYAKN